MNTPSTPGEPMIQCPICRTRLPAGSRFCPNDGTPLTETAALSSVPTPATSLPSQVDMQLPTVVGGRYRLTSIRGGGGMARVYQAQDMTLEREVAVKLINPQLRTDPEFDARFQREARIASKLNDPHIVVVHDFGLDPAHGPYLVMEFLQGQSLREHLQSKGPLPFKAALQMAGQLLLALIHAHGQGIIHRDIKPDNLFLMNISGVRLHVRVLDFGIARIMNREAAAGAQLTSPGSVLGTPRYMSPEQLAGLPLDARSDLYSAALVIYEALTGQVPHPRGKNLREVLPDLPQPFADLIAQCLEQDPDKRPSSALEAFLQLQEMGKASGVLLLPAGAMERLADARRQAQGLAHSRAADTVPETPGGMSRGRRIVVGLVALVLLAAFLAVVKFVFFPTLAAVPNGPESLLGVAIGAEQAGVVKNLKLTKGGVLNPFAEPRRPFYLAHTLKAEDLALPPADLARLDVQRTADENVCVLFLDGKVRAVVVRENPSASSNRRVRIGGSVSDIYDRYPEGAETVSVSLGAEEEDREHRKHVSVHRLDGIGIAFETYGSKITAISLYPPRQ